MIRQISVLVVAALIFSFPVCGKEKEIAPKFKILEVRHFSRAEDVEIPLNIHELLYAQLLGGMKHMRIAEQTIGEGEVVDAFDVSRAVTLDGEFLQIKQGSPLKEHFVGWGAGSKSLRIRFVIRRYNTTDVVFERIITKKLLSSSTDEEITNYVAGQFFREVQKHFKR